MIDYIFNNTDCIFYFYPYLFLRNIIYIFRNCCYLFLKKKKQMLKIYFCKFYFRVLKNKIVCYATCNVLNKYQICHVTSVSGVLFWKLSKLFHFYI